MGDNNLKNHKFYLKDYDYISDLKHKKILIIVSNTNVFAYSSVLIDILNIIKLSKGNAKLVWYEDIEYKFLNSINRYFNSISELNQKSYEYCKNLKDLYDDILKIEKYKNLDYSKLSRSYKALTPDSIKITNAELWRSIHSDWFGKNLKTLNFNVQGRKEQKRFKFDVKRFILGFNLVKHYIQDFDILILPNGKYPHQVGMKQAALKYDKQVFFYEKDNNRTFLQTFQTQDFENLSKALKVWIDSASEEDKQSWINWAEIWLENQKTDLNQNIFLLNQERESHRAAKFRKLLLKNKLKTVPIFTSSLDEKVSNLPKDLNGWDSQIEAITHCAEIIKSQGFFPHIRLHPNLELKSVREMIEIFNWLEIKNLSYQLPWDGPSTYWHLENSTSVVTWGATVALEALATGVPTINLGPSRYKYASGIITADKKSINHINFENIILPDRRKALLAIYACRNYGLQNGSFRDIKDINLNGINNSKHQAKMFVNRLELLKLFIFSPLNLSSRDFIRILSIFFGQELAKKIYYCFLKLCALKFKLVKNFQ